MNPTRDANRHRCRAGALAGLVCLALAFSGCSLLHFGSGPEKAQVTSFQLATNVAPNAVTAATLQAQVMRFADSYVAVISQAADDFAAKVGTSEARLGAMKWKLGQATSAYIDATGENPVVNALDMLVLVTVSRMVMEDYGVGKYGQAAMPLLEVQREMETNAWGIARGMLKPNQEQELRGFIQDWRRKYPYQRYVGAVRFREFVAGINQMPQTAKVAPNSIFSLLFLDPFAGLDPTAAAIAETRQLGERAMYYTQRMPQLLNWQAELLAYQLAVQPESRQVLSNADQLAASAEAFARTAQQLPQLINDQRQAAIQQVLDGLRSQQADVRQTLNAGGDAATAIRGAIESLDKFVHYVYTPDTNAAVETTNSSSFNVLDYGTAATQIGSAARDLQALLTTLNQSTPRLGQLGDQAAADANRVVDHAFWRGLILIVVLLVGAVAAGLTYRILANRLSGDARKSGRPDPGAT